MKIIPANGYILAKIYTPTNQVFKSTKEEPGDAVVSEVVAVGDPIVTDGNITRESPCKVGDIIIHRYTQDTLEDFNHDYYRFVFFGDYRGKYVNE